MAYDKNNIFAKILRAEIPCNTVYDGEHSLAFNDINPQAKAHALVIPKGAYGSFTDFAENASDTEIVAFVRDIAKVAKQLGVEKSGYRLLINNGEDSNQEVPHLHTHIVGGQNLGKLLPAS